MNMANVPQKSAADMIGLGSRLRCWGVPSGDFAHPLSTYMAGSNLAVTAKQCSRVSVESPTDWLNLKYLFRRSGQKIIDDFDPLV